MADKSYLSWPFFEARHRELAARLEGWCDEWIDDAEPSDPSAACRALVAEYGRAGFLKLCVADDDSRPDVRSLSICREILARHHGLADFAFAMRASARLSRTG
jgi:acyl-CoA dehydrogenase